MDENGCKGLRFAAPAALCSLIGWVPVITMQVAPLSEYPVRLLSLALSPIAAVVWGILGLVLGLVALTRHPSGLVYGLSLVAIELGVTLPLTAGALFMFMLLPAWLSTIGLLLLASLVAILLVTRKSKATGEEESQGPPYLAWVGLSLVGLSWLLLLEKGLLQPYGDDASIYFRVVICLITAFLFGFWALLVNRQDKLAVMTLVLVPPAYALAGCWYFLSLMY